MVGEFSSLEDSGEIKLSESVPQALSGDYETGISPPQSLLASLEE